MDRQPSRPEALSGLAAPSRGASSSALALVALLLVVGALLLGMTRLGAVEREAAIQQQTAETKRSGAEQANALVAERLREALDGAVEEVASHGGARAETVPPESFEGLPYLVWRGAPTRHYSAMWRPSGRDGGYGLEAMDPAGLASALEAEVKERLLVEFKDLESRSGLRPSYPHVRVTVGEDHVRASLEGLTVQSGEDVFSVPVEAESPARLGLLHAVAGELAANHLARRGFERSLVHTFLDNDRRPEMRLFHCCGPCDPTWEAEAIEHGQVQPLVAEDARAAVAFEQGYARTRYRGSFPQVKGVLVSMRVQEPGVELSLRDLNPDRAGECAADPSACRGRVEKVPILGAVQMGRWDALYSLSFPVRVDVMDTQARLQSSEGARLVPLVFSFVLDAYVRDCSSCMPSCVASDAPSAGGASCEGACSLTIAVRDSGGRPVAGCQLSLNGCAVEPRTGQDGTVSVAKAPCEWADALVTPPEGSGFAPARASVYVERTTRETVFLRRSVGVSGRVYAVERELCQPRRCARTVEAQRPLPPVMRDPPSYVRLTFIDLRDRTTRSAVVGERSRYSISDVVEGRYLVVAEGAGEYRMHYATILDVEGGEGERDIAIQPAFIVETGAGTERVSRVAQGECSC